MYLSFSQTNRKLSLMTKPINRLLMIFITLTSISIVHAEEIDTASSIKAVTIYPGSAKITRTARVSVPAGSSSIVIRNLPSNMNQSSLRVTGEGQQTVKLGHVEISQKIQQEVVNEQERTIKLQIEDVKLERKEVDDALLRNRYQLEYIRKMVMGQSVLPQGKPTNPDTDNNYKNKNSYSQLPLEQWQQAWDTLDMATSRVQEKIRMAQKTRTDFDKKIKKLEAELRQVAVNNRQPSTLIARMQMETVAPTELALHISYQINGAYWTPIYDADLNTQSGEVALNTLSKISQRTGEDWKDVKLTLSTLRPSEGTQLPALNTWALDFMPEMAPSYSKRMGSTMDSAVVATEQLQKESDYSGSFASKKLRRPAPKKAMVAEESTLSIADFSAEYHVPGLVSLKSGSNSRRFALNSQTLSSKIQLASAPRQDARAMILSTIKYKGETPLLAGNVSLYRNTSFVGNTYLKQVLPSEEVKLSFGEDDKVRITFQPDPDKNRKDGLLFGKRKVVERHYQVSISSQHNKPYPITLFDVLPVSSDENISVKKLGEVPNRIDIEDKKGVVSWTRTLAADKKIKLKYGYAVSYPEGRAVIGL